MKVGDMKIPAPVMETEAPKKTKPRPKPKLTAKAVEV